MPNLKANSDLSRILLFAAAAALAIIAIIALFSSIVNSVESDNYYDDISKTDMTRSNTGAMTENTLSIVGSDKIYDGTLLTSDDEVDSAAIVSKYVSLAYPKAKQISYRDKTVKREENKLSFEIQLDTGNRLSVAIEAKDEGGYTLNLLDKNNEVFSYESRKYLSDHANIKSLPLNYLPVTLKTADGTQFAFRYNEESGYSIYINACDNTGMYEEARSIVVNWLKARSFDPDEITINIPKLCDGGI